MYSQTRDVEDGIVLVLNIVSQVLMNRNIDHFRYIKISNFQYFKISKFRYINISNFWYPEISNSRYIGISEFRYFKISCFAPRHPLTCIHLSTFSCFVCWHICARKLRYVYTYYTYVRTRYQINVGIVSIRFVEYRYLIEFGSLVRYPAMPQTRGERLQKPVFYRAPCSHKIRTYI